MRIDSIQFTGSTLTPDGINKRRGEPMYSFNYAYKLEEVRDYLFN